VKFAAEKKPILNNIIEIQEFLNREIKPKVVITTHHKPDADALGSSLGLFNFLKKIGVEATVISPTNYGDFLKWLPGEEFVLNYEQKPLICQEITKAADLIFCLDFNSLSRLDKFAEVVRNSSAKKVLIDHHLEPEDFDDYRLWSTKASSTCELVFWFIEILKKVDVIDSDIAACLYAGLMTDTASFRHNTTSPTTHRVAAILLEKGAVPNLINENIYDNYSADRTRLIGYCISNKLEIIPEFNTALITVTSEELERFNVKTGDTEGLVNIPLTIKGIKLAVLIVDRHRLRKMSFRSKGNFPANTFARTYFNGGGHFSAAGGESSDTLENVIAKFKTSIQDFKEYLINNK